MKKTVQILIEKAAEINLKDNNGWTPLDLPVKKCHDKTIKLISGKE